MKVLLVNGSPHEKGCTYTALAEMKTELEKEGIEANIYHIGTQAIHPCLGCYACRQLGKCIMEKDDVNAFVHMAEQYDAFVFGTPVHYASASGVIVPFMDRVFFSAANAKKSVFRHKPATAIVSARRAGTTPTIDQLNKYFQISEMPVISGRYWNMVHGSTPDDVRRDKEGMQNMRILARNMAYFLKCLAAAKAAGLTPPAVEKPELTNFIRD